MTKFDPSKLTGVVRLLYEISIIKNLSPQKLAPYLGFSHVQIWRWFQGAEPKKDSERLILEGIEKIKQVIPGDPKQDGLVPWDLRWTEEEARAEEEKKNKPIHDKIDRFFRELSKKVSETEAAIYLTPEAVEDFQNLVFLAEKYGIEFPAAGLKLHRPSLEVRPKSQESRRDRSSKKQKK